MAKIFLVGIICFISSYTHQSRTEYTNQGVTENEIYDVLEFVIEDQKLKKQFGLNIFPGDRCDEQNEDDKFLSDLIREPHAIDQSTSREDLKISISMDSHSLELERCITKADVEFMLHQKELSKGFTWDNSKLGFNLANDDQWYEFSVPLFSGDKTKAIFSVRELCKGLCGTSQTFLVEMKDKRWTTKTGIRYIH